MTVGTSSYSAQTYNGNGSTKIFSTSFPFLESSHIVVILISSGGAETTQILGTHYTLTGGNGAAGTVTMVTAPASGAQLRISRITTKTQSTDYIENDSFPAEAHEKAIDKLTLITQEIAEASVVSYPISILKGGTGSTSSSAARTALGLVIGTDVQAYSTYLSTIAGLSVTDGNFIVGNGTTWVAESGATARTSLGLGSISTQDAGSVSITGGSVAGITDLAIADGGTGASTAANARTNLGLGTISTQASSSVSITGGSITGITDLVVGDGGTGASSFTAYSVLCGGTTSTGALQNVVGIGSSGQVLTSNGAGTLPTWQAASGGTTITGSPTLNNFAVGDGTNWASTTPANSRTALGLVIGTDVQAYAAGLTTLSSLSVTDGNFIVGDGTTWVVESGVTARTSLGLGTIATQDSSSVSITGGSITGITDIAVADGGTGVSSTTAYAVICGGTTSTGALQSVSGVGTSGQVLTSNGDGALPTWQAAGGGGGGGGGGGSGNWEYVSGATAAGSASVDFTGLSSTYILYQVVITDMKSASDYPDMYVRTTANSGSSWDDGSTDYLYTGAHTSSGSGSISANSTGAPQILVARELGNATNEYINGTILIYNPAGTNYTMIQSRLTHHSYNAGELWRAEVDGQRTSAAAVNGIRILLGGANIASGSFKLYGLKPS